MAGEVALKSSKTVTARKFPLTRAYFAPPLPPVFSPANRCVCTALPGLRGVEVQLARGVVRVLLTEGGGERGRVSEDFKEFDSCVWGGEKENVENENEKRVWA